MDNIVVKRDYFDILFRLGMWWKIFYGLLNIILGVTLLNFVNNSFTELFYKIMSHELIEDPNDIFLNSVRFIFDKNLVNISYFISIYFIFWGTIGFFLSINLLQLKMWSYPTSLFLMSFFTLYEVYRVTYTHSIVLFIIILIDFCIIWLINNKYIKLKRLKSNTNLV